VAGAFQGWPEDFQRFFLGLQMDNSKAYFEANRKLYLTAVKAPLEALLADVEAEFGPGKIARPNRDIRFAADKSPYKTNIYAGLERGGYVSLDARNLVSAAGEYEIDPIRLQAYRAAVAEDRSGVQLAGIVADLEDKGYKVGGEELKRVPAGFPQDHPRARLLRHKRLFAWKEFGLQPWLGTAGAKDHITQVWRDARALTGWAAEHLPAAQPGAGRRR
jgi:uncharacterized protein (TIGR02453 family)